MTKTEWRQDEQDFLAKMEHQCNIYYDHYTKEHTYYIKLSSRFNIPILVISAINALTAIALNSFIRQEYVSVMNAVLSSGTGVLGSIQLYTKLNEKMTNALRASILMKRLALKISKELSIEMAHRTSDPQGFLSDCFAEFNTALEQGNPIEKSLSNHLAFTQIPKKEKYSLIGLSFSGSRGNSSRHEEPRAKKLWGLVDTIRTGARSLPESSSPSHPSDSYPTAGTPEEQDIELANRGS